MTSAQVNELVQITLTNAAALNNQSKAFPDAIAAATSLTKGWAASLKVVGIPLNQARQEINSIIKGQITQDSILAKNLNITNQQVESWRSQGKLVDELNERLDVFVAGNAIAARSIEGISSNILDLGERITRTIGEPFLEPLINSLAEVEKYLKSSEVGITLLFSQLSAEIIGAGSSIGEAFAPLGKTLLEIGADFGPIALSTVKGLLQVFVGLSQVIGPLANLIAQAFEVLTNFAATDLGGIVVQTGAIILVMGQLQTIIIGLAVSAMPILSAAVMGTYSSMLLLVQSVKAVGVVTTVSTAGMGAFSGAMKLLTAEAIALNLALIPLTAAIALTVLVRTTNDLQDANDALEAYGNQILTTVDAVGMVSVELNQLNKITAAGGVLTEEQIKRQKQLNASAQAQAEGIQTQIKALKDLKLTNADNARQRDNDIKALEALSAKLDKATGGIKLQSKELEELGTTSEQFAKKLENANRNIRTEGQGDANQFKEAAKQVIALAKSGVDAKLLTVEAARAQLEVIKNNTKVDLETQTAAKEAIGKLYDGRIAKVKELIEVGTLQATLGLDELAKIRDDITLGAATRRKAGQQIVTIRKEQIAAETAAIAAGQAEISALQSQQRIGEAKADEETTKVKLDEIAKRIEATKVAQENATSDTERAKLKADLAKDTAELDKLDAELAARRRKRAIEDFDERRNLIKAQNDLGAIDRGTYNQQVLLNDIAQNDAALAQQRTALAKLGANDREGREAINSQIAQLQSKRVEIARVYDQADLKRQTEYYDQELISLETFRNQKLISEDEFIKQKSQSQAARADAELVVAQRELERLGKNDVEGRNAINTKINELSNRRLKALEESYQAELVLVKDAQTKALDLVIQSEQQRSIDLQKLVNDRLIHQEDADKERSRQTASKQRAELQAAQDFESALARTAGAARSPEVERAYQEQVQQARAKTLAATLAALQTEGAEQERLRTLTLKSIEDGVAARARAADLQLSQIAQLAGERDRAAKSAEANAAREVAAIEIATKSLERQGALRIAQNNLAKASSDATLGKGDLEIERLNQALAIRQELEAGIVPYAEYQVKIQRLQELGVSSSASTFEIQQRKLELEQQQSGLRLDALTLEQTAAKGALTLEQQKIDLANQRLLIEARIAEFKAKQAVLDARSNAQQTEQNNRKSLDAAQLALTQAQSQQPGRERDRAISEAQNRLAIAKAEAQANRENATQGIDLANEQVKLAAQNTQAARAQVESQAEVKKLQTETLDIQQRTVLEQFKAVEAARLYANELERAKAASESISKTTQPQTIFSGKGVQTLPARAGGGNVSAGRAYLVGENSPEVFVPNVSGTVLNREQVMKNLGSLGDLNLNLQGGKGNDNREVIGAIRGLEQTILSRPPAAIVANFTAPDDGGMDKLFALQRSSLRIN